MKKLALAVAVTGALGASATNAALVTEFANGVLIPHVQFDGGTDTAIGVTSCAAGVVYWTFFDADSKHVQDDAFRMTRNDQQNFTWSQVAGVDLDGELGYMVLVLDTNGDGALTSSDVPCLTGAAFQLYPGNDEVAFLPVPPLFEGNDFRDVATPGALALLDENSVTGATGAADTNDVIYNRYWIDNAAGGRDTAIVIWSAQSLKNQSFTVFMYNDDQDASSVNIDFPNAELNIIDPETIRGRNPNFLDGFILWDLSTAQYRATTAGGEDGVLSFSIIFDGTIASQTIVNPILRR